MAFAASGESRRQISWDFTVPPELAIASGPGRVAVPIATFGKRSLRRFDVRDSSGKALSIWSRVQNGHLACQLLTAGLEGVYERALRPKESDAVRRVVFANHRDEVAEDLRALFTGPSGCESQQKADLVETVHELARSLADGFLVVIELPREAVGTRSLVKASFDDVRITGSRRRWERLVGRATIDIEGRGWGEADSWHIEAHAPDGLTVARLRYDVWDNSTADLLDQDEDHRSESTAHLVGQAVPPGYQAAAQVRLAPTNPGLINQVTTGVMFAAVLLLTASSASEQIHDRLQEAGRSGPLAAVAFSVPAFLLALLSRGPEHALVSQVLMAPRLASFFSALSLWGAGLIMVWNPTQPTLERTFAWLAVLQVALMVWMGMVRSVGSRD